MPFRYTEIKNVQLPHMLSNFLTYDERKEIREWCQDQFDPLGWDISISEKTKDSYLNAYRGTWTTFYFANQGSAAEFRLKWDR